MTDEERAERDSKYDKLLALYIALLRSLHDDYEEKLYELSEQRCAYAIEAVLSGLGVDAEYASQLLKAKDDNTLTEHDSEMRDRILAAFRNIIDFSVAEEYQLYRESLDIAGDSDVDFDSDEYEKMKDACHRYNYVYAAVEDSDIEYAGAMAAWWISVARNEYLMYLTQGDDRVRPWHAALEGFSARRDEFPQWMIPPIEWGCRCYLITMAGDVVEGALDARKVVAKAPSKPSQIDGVFSESLAKCGRIFSSSHPYFQIMESDESMLQGFVERLREKWNAG